MFRSASLGFAFVAFFAACSEPLVALAGFWLRALVAFPVDFGRGGELAWVFGQDSEVVALRGRSVFARTSSSIQQFHRSLGRPERWLGDVEMDRPANRRLTVRISYR